MGEPARPLPPRLLTIEEWADMDEAEPGEFVDGVLVDEEEVGALHESIVVFMATVLRVWLGTRGRVLTSDAKFALSPRRGRKPDLTMWLTRVKLPRHAAIRVPPDVAIEVVSPRAKDRRRDRFEKLVEYAQFGVHYYWLVDPETQTLEVLERRVFEGQDRGTYAIVLTASAGRVAVPGCDGLELDLDALWAEIDGLEDE